MVSYAAENEISTGIARAPVTMTEPGVQVGSSAFRSFSLVIPFKV